MILLSSFELINKAYTYFPGLLREPKFGHLRDVHRALRLSKKALLWGVPSVQKINEDLEVSISSYVC